MSDWAVSVNRLLRKIPDGYKDSTPDIVSLVGRVMDGSRGAGRTPSEQEDLQHWISELTSLEQEFVAEHHETCGKSLEVFMSLVTDLEQSQSLVSDIKRTVLRMHAEMSPHASDIINLTRRRSRNDYTLQVLRAAQAIASMEHIVKQCMAKREYLRCATELQWYQSLLDQWPQSSDGGGAKADLSSLHQQLHSSLSQEKLTAHCHHIMTALKDSIMRRDCLALDIFNRGVEEVKTDTADIASGGQATSRTSNSRLTAKTSRGNVSLSVTPFINNESLWYDATAIVQRLPRKLLSAKLLLGPKLIPAATQISINIPNTAVVYVLLRPGYLDGGWGETLRAPTWVTEDLCFDIVGLVDGGGAAALAPEQPAWRLRKAVITRSGQTVLPTTNTDACVAIIVVQDQAPASLFRLECVSALHAIGCVGYSTSRRPYSRLVEVAEGLLEKEALRMEFRRYIEEFAKCLVEWLEDKEGDIKDAKGADLTELLRGLRDIDQGALQSLGVGESADTERFETEQRLALLQRPQVQHIIFTLLDELLHALKNYAEFVKRVRERAFPFLPSDPRNGSTPDKWNISKAHLDATDLSAISADLVRCSTAAPEEAGDDDVDTALKVVEGAARLLAEGGPLDLTRLVGPRRAEGWLGIPPKRDVVVHLTKSPNEDVGVTLDPYLAIVGIRDKSSAQQGGLPKMIGCRVVAVGRGEKRVKLKRPEDFNKIVGDAEKVTLYLQRPASRPPPHVRLCGVVKRVEEAIHMAGAECHADEESVKTALDALVRATQQSVSACCTRLLESNHIVLDLSAVWDCLQHETVPVLNLLLARDAGECLTKERRSSSFMDSLTIEKLLGAGADRMPRLMEGAPPVRFSFPNAVETASNSDTFRTVLDQVTKHILPTPLNAVSIYRPVKQFLEDARRVVGANAPCMLRSLVEESVVSELIPRLVNSATARITAAAHPSLFFKPVPLTDGNPNEPPVLEMFVTAAQALHTCFSLPEALPFCTIHVHSDSGPVVDKVIECAYAALEERLHQVWCGDLVLPMLSSVWSETGEVFFNAQAVVPTFVDSWRKLCVAKRDGDIRTPILDLLQSRRRKTRNIEVIESSTDLGCLASLAHSLEWLADQLTLLGSTVEGEELLSSRTPCYQSPVPGVAYRPSREDHVISASAASVDIGEDVQSECSDDSLPAASPSPPERLPTPRIGVLYRKLIVLSRAAFFALEADLYARCVVHLDYHDINYDRTHQISEPDAFVERFNRDLRRVHIILSQYLPLEKQHFIMSSLPRLVASLMVSSIQHLRCKRITEHGIGQLRRNVNALQQNLALLDPVPRQSDHFARVQRYYDILSVPLMGFTTHVLDLYDQGLADFSKDELVAAFEVVLHSREGKGGRDIDTSELLTDLLTELKLTHISPSIQSSATQPAIAPPVVPPGSILGSSAMV